MSIDIERVRMDTPSCHRMIHFNNAGASLSPTPVMSAVMSHLAREQEIGGYEAQAEATLALEGFYTGFASLLNAEPDEVAFVESATRAWDMVFYSLPLAEGDRVLTHASEYASNYLALLHQAKRLGIEIDVVPSNASGEIDVEALEKMINPRTRLIAITHVPTQGGLVNPVEDVGQIARKNGLLYLLDACQSVGQMPVDVKQIGCHFLSGTGRKYLRGPRGTGFLFVSRDVLDQLDPPFIDLRAATWTGPDTYTWADGARRFENFEGHVAGKLGLAKAVQYAQAIGLDHIHERTAGLAARLRNLLAERPRVTVHDLGNRRSGIVTFMVDGEEPSETGGFVDEHFGVRSSTCAVGLWTARHRVVG